MEVNTSINWTAFACIEWSIAFAICVFSVGGFIAIWRTTKQPKRERY